MISVDRLIHQKHFVIVYTIAVVQNIVLVKHLRGFVPKLCHFGRACTNTAVTECNDTERIDLGSQ